MARSAGGGHEAEMNSRARDPHALEAPRSQGPGLAVAIGSQMARDLLAQMRPPASRRARDLAESAENELDRKGGG